MHFHAKACRTRVTGISFKLAPPLISPLHIVKDVAGNAATWFLARAKSHGRGFSFCDGLRPLGFLNRVMPLAIIFQHGFQRLFQVRRAQEFLNAF